MIFAPYILKYIIPLHDFFKFFLIRVIYFKLIGNFAEKRVFRSF